MQMITIFKVLFVDLPDQLLQVARLGSRYETKHGRIGADGLIHAVQEKHVEVHNFSKI
jgi:hypothetical protein